jgi:hypothetical protein
LLAVSTTQARPHAVWRGRRGVLAMEIFPGLAWTFVDPV